MLHANRHLSMIHHGIMHFTFHRVLLAIPGLIVPLKHSGTWVPEWEQKHGMGRTVRSDSEQAEWMQLKVDLTLGTVVEGRRQGTATCPPIASVTAPQTVRLQRCGVHGCHGAVSSETSLPVYQTLRAVKSHKTRTTRLLLVRPQGFKQDSCNSAEYFHNKWNNVQQYTVLGGNSL
jgi:hypothetical protein